MPKNKYWELEGEELEEHLANDCALSIIEPMETTEYYDERERELLAQFPKDRPETPEYDAVLRVDLVGARGAEVPESTALYLLTGMAGERQQVGDIFKTGRYWCMRVRNV